MFEDDDRKEKRKKRLDKNKRGKPSDGEKRIKLPKKGRNKENLHQDYEYA
jgi:hypothetical protein